MNRIHPKINAYFSKEKRWRLELETLRKIILGCQLTEELKWGSPCYTLRDSNIAILQAFKEYCALMFFKGALLKDAKGILIRPGQHTQAGRQLRFTSVEDVLEMGSVLKSYILEAIEIETAGLKVALKKTEDYAIPRELTQRLDGSPALQAAFDKLTPGRRRAYILHFSQPKRPETRALRVDKCMPLILDGKGLND